MAAGAGVRHARPAVPVPGRLDHDFYDHRAGARSAAPAWPDGRKAAAFVMIHVETFELDAPADALREPRLGGDFGSFHPDLRTHSLIEYGSRIGVFRLLDLLQPLGWRVAAAVNGKVAMDKPQLLRMLAQRDVEVLASGWSASRMVTSAMPEAEERCLLAQSIDAIAQASGARPCGYASQDYGFSRRTPSLLQEAGITFAVDWPNDELPYRFGPDRSIVLIPAAAELDDAQAMLARKRQPREWAAMVSDALEWWRGDALPGSVLALPLHAAVAGAPHRSRALQRTLSGTPAEAFWQALPSVIADAWRVANAGPWQRQSELSSADAGLVSTHRPGTQDAP